MKNLIDLETKDILQINATIIAGAIIFLTFIGNVFVGEKDFSLLSGAVIIMLVTIMVFSASSMSALTRQKDDALRGMVIGFFIFVFFGFIILILLVITTTIELINHFIPANQTISNPFVINQTILNQTIG